MWCEVAFRELVPAQYSLKSLSLGNINTSRYNASNIMDLVPGRSVLVGWGGQSEESRAVAGTWRSRRASRASSSIKCH